MELAYLIFDFTDEDSGSGSFDALASVRADRVPALAAEVESVLRWAHDAFGAPLPAGGDGGWDFDLQGTSASDAPWPIAYDAGTGRLSFAPPGAGHSTLSLTVSGPPAFCDALREAFSL